MQLDPAHQLDRAVFDIFAVMLNLTCTAEDSPGSKPSVRNQLSASVLFSGSLEGVCTFSLTAHTAAELAANLLGLPAAEISSELSADTTAELCNMIAGSWKSTQSRLADECVISCPTAGASRILNPRCTVSRLYRFDGRCCTLDILLA